MSEAIIRTAPFAGRRGEGIGARLNRLSLAWLARFEDTAQRRRDRRILAGMSDGELADIGLAPGATEQAFRASRDATLIRSSRPSRRTA